MTFYRAGSTKHVYFIYCIALLQYIIIQNLLSRSAKHGRNLVHFVYYIVQATVLFSALVQMWVYTKVQGTTIL